MSRPHVVTPAELSSLRDLELVARATVEGLRQGMHRSPFHGYNAEFSQYRHYRPGDDLKYVDWKAFGRTNRLYTRQFRETTNLAALFVMDVSRSMHFEGKFGLAQSVAAVLGTLVLDQGDSVGLLAVAEPVVYLPPRSGHHHLRVYLSQLAQLTPDALPSTALGTRGRTDGRAGTIARGLTRAATLLKRRGLVIAISDFYEDDEALVEIRRLSRMGHDVIVVQTLAAGELTLDLAGAAEVVDAETGRTLVVQPERARAAYSERVQAWLTAFGASVAREGIDYLRLTTSDPLDRQLRRFLVSRRGGA